MSLSDNNVIRHRADAYRVANRVLVNSVARTRAGFSVATEPWISLPTELQPTELGQALAEALSNSKTDLPLPIDYKALKAARFSSAGVRSERQFMQSALFVTIESDGSGISLIPSRNAGWLGEQKGFHLLEDQTVRVSITADSAALGVALVKAWSLCQ